MTSKSLKRIRTAVLPALFIISLLLASAPTVIADTPNKDPKKTIEAPKDILGAWKDTEKESYVLFEKERAIVYVNKKQIISKIIEWREEQVVLRITGFINTFRFKVKKNKLELFKSGASDPSDTYNKLPETPGVLVFEPMKLPAPDSISEKITKTIQAELKKRVQEDQAVRKNAARRKEMAKVDADNTKWLEKTIKEYGWIDAKRFGAETSNHAFLIVQHSGALPMMAAVLPEIEKDLKAGRLRDGQAFALLYDRLKLDLGEKQKYGTQVTQKNNKGELFVFPLENKQKVEEYRKELNMFSLQFYLRVFLQRTGAKTIKYMEDDPPETTSKTK